ncbi:MAG: hypothetical protein ACRDWE_06050 [Acidimicrobiales bacterium]
MSKSDSSRAKRKVVRPAEQGPLDDMFLVYLSIPLMVLAWAVATVPLIIAMRTEEKEKREALAGTTLAGFEPRRSGERIAA